LQKKFLVPGEIPLARARIGSSETPMPRADQLAVILDGD
jgi:hypothetical protein